MRPCARLSEARSGFRLGPGAAGSKLFGIVLLQELGHSLRTARHHVAALVALFYSARLGTWKQMPSHFAVGKTSTADVKAAKSRKRGSDSRPTHDLHASFLKRADSASARSINRACTASSTCSEEVVVNTMSLAAPVRAGVLATARPRLRHRADRVLGRASGYSASTAHAVTTTGKTGS